MIKFLLGLVLGTLLGFVVASSIRNNAVAPATSFSPTTADKTEVSGLSPDTQSESEATAALAKLSEAAPSTSTPSTSASATALGELARPAPSTNPLPSTQAAPERDVSRATSSQPRTLIALPEAIKPFLEKSDTHDGLTLGQMHTKLEDESEDLAWSYQMELYLQQFFARPTKSGQPLDIHGIECRTTMCEIVGFSTLANPMDDIGPLLQQMAQQPWWDFDSMNSTAAGDGVGGKFLLFLRRKR